MKNVRMYKLNDPITITGDVLDQYPLRDCGQEELSTYGWVSAYRNGDDLIEECNNSKVIRLGMFVKKLPRKAILTEARKRFKDNPHVKFKELEELVTQEFIGKTYPEEDEILAYVDQDSQVLYIDASSENRASLVTAVFRKTLGSLPITHHVPQVDFSHMVTRWVQHGLPSEKFGYCDEVELKELNKDDGAIVRYKNIICDAPEIMKHIEEGWSVTKIRMVYDDLVTFTIDKDFTLKNVKYLDRFQLMKSSEKDDLYNHERSEMFLTIEVIRDLTRDLFNMFYGVGE